MSDSMREYIRQAQTAELAGDAPRAVELLRRAAEGYRSTGALGRALQMLRHARRLVAGQAGVELDAAIAGLERGDGAPLDVPAPVALQQGAGTRTTLVASSTTVTEPEPESARSAGRGNSRMVDRGPTRADPRVEAWCSFCCKPRAEVGELVAGPAGAYVCGACLRESASLLGVELAPGIAPAAASGAKPARKLPRAGDSTFNAHLVGQETPRAQLEAALAHGLHHVLLTGPEGCGKSVYLGELVRAGRAEWLRPDDLRAPQRADILVVDGVDSWAQEAQAGLARWLAVSTGQRVILAARGHALEPAVTLRDEAAVLPLLTTAAIVEALGGHVLPVLAERVQAAFDFVLLTEEQLVEVARGMLGARANELFVAEQVLSALAAAAVRSPRGGHELVALVSRIPAGYWSLESLDEATRRHARKGKG